MRAMSSPLGTVQRASSRPTGSASAATSSTPFAIASMRLSSRSSRSSSASVNPPSRPARTSSALAARISRFCARMAAAAASSALFFVSVEASRMARAASRACCPSASISSFKREGSRAFMPLCRSMRGHRDGSSHRGHDSPEWPRCPPCACPRCAPHPRRHRPQGPEQSRAPAGL